MKKRRPGGKRATVRIPGLERAGLRNIPQPWPSVAARPPGPPGEAPA